MKLNNLILKNRRLLLLSIIITVISCFAADKIKIIEKGFYRSNGSLKFKQVTKYDKNDNIIEEARFNKDGSLYSDYIYRYSYDKKGYLSEVRYTNENGTIEKKWKNNLSIKSNTKKTIKEDNLLIKLNKYEKKIEETKYSSSGRIIYSIMFKYDKNNILLEEAVFNTKSFPKFKLLKK